MGFMVRALFPSPPPSTPNPPPSASPRLLSLSARRYVRLNDSNMEFWRRLPNFRELNPGKPSVIDGNKSVEPFAREREGEKVFLKPTWDAFNGTGLHEHLCQQNVGRILVAGLITSVCVQHTGALSPPSPKLYTPTPVARVRRRMRASVLCCKFAVLLCGVASVLRRMVRCRVHVAWQPTLRLGHAVHAARCALLRGWCNTQVPNRSFLSAAWRKGALASAYVGLSYLF